MSEGKNSQRLIRFGVYELDPSAGELRKDGARVRLQEKPFQVLAILLERPGQVVTREEFQQRIWPDTFIDIEGSLSTAVKKARDALDDDNANPRFIETRPGYGYRFIYPVEGSVDQTAPRRLPGGWAHWVWWLTGAAAVAIIVLAVTIYQIRSAQAFTEGDYVLITDFSNTTGDEIFDGTLKQGLAIKLAESPFIDIFPERQARVTLRRMERPPDESITPELGREICLRRNIKAMITGEIAQLGSSYALTLNAINCRTGELLAGEQVQAGSKEEVLDALGQATTRIRRALGESLASIEEIDTPLAQATTSSLEALKAYTIALKLRLSVGGEAAIPFLERAIELDPNFAKAHASLGTIYGDRREDELAVKYKTKAFELRDRVTERERFYITSAYHMHVSGDWNKWADVCKTWKHVYPRDATPRAYLSVAYAALGRHEKAFEAGLEAKRISSTAFTYNSLIKNYLNFNKIGEAKKLSGEALANGFDTFSIRRNLYYIAFLEGDEEAMRLHVEKAEGKSFWSEFLTIQARAAASLGKREQARQLFRRGVDVALELNFQEAAAMVIARTGEMEAFFGYYPSGLELADKALALSRSRDSQCLSAFALAWGGDTTRAEKLADDLAERFPHDTYVNHLCLPAIRAAVDLKRNDLANTIERLDQTAAYKLSYNGARVIYTRGETFLRTGQGDNAANEFRIILGNRGLFRKSPQYQPLAHLGLARAKTLMGDTDGARRAYEDFFDLWKDADPGIPILLEAQAEYAKLNQ